MSASAMIALGIAFLLSPRLGGALLFLMGLAGGGLSGVLAWLGQILNHLLQLLH
ncbi:MAG: hypothetical protein H5T70_10075 [Chloroflexi bacterium]|nr:hypothetical protein [Thermoleophilia bacterium]MBC7316753.1 hypothetical protein [Chloroflexota bacterium]